MPQEFGPWSTAMSDPSVTQLSTFWKRRMGMLPVLSRSRWQPSRRTAWGLLFLGLTACAVPTVWHAPLLADSPAGEPALSNPPAKVELADGDVTLLDVLEFGDLFTVFASNADEAAAQKEKAEKAARDAEAAAVARNRDSRLEKLEAQLAELLKEVKSLRGGEGATAIHEYRIKSATSPQSVLSYVQSVPKPAPPAKASQAAPATPALPGVTYGTSSVTPVPRSTTAGAAAVRSPLWVVKADPTTANEQIVLSRVTYKIPQAKATALESFLKEHVKASVLEMRADGDALVVTTTAEVQQGIGMLVNLMQSSEPKIRLRLDHKIEPTDAKEPAKNEPEKK